MSNSTATTQTPATTLPLVGFVAVPLPTHGHALRSTWLNPNTAIVGYDPQRLTRELAAMVIRYELGAFKDIDGGEQP